MADKKKREIAILLATYNSGDYLRELLDSLLNQSYKDFVCYAHDDGSKDGTPDILRHYAENTDLEMVILNYPPTGSAKANFMSMIKYVEEPYLMFCDHDDVWLDNKIEKSITRIKAIEENGMPALVFTDLYVVDQNLNVIDDSFMRYSGINPRRYNFNDLLLENVAPGCTMIANKALYKMANELQDCNSIRMHDHWFMLLAAGAGIIDFIDEPLILYRQHNDNELGAVKKTSAIKRAQIITNKIIARQYKKDFRKWIAIMQSQASEVADIEGVRPEYRAMCMEFSSINDENKLRRVAFYYKNAILRRKYNLWFLLCC